MTTQPRVKNDNLPISRELMLAKFKRELAEMKEYLAHFHDELLSEHRIVTIIYPRIMLEEAHEGASKALRNLDMLDEFLANEGLGLTEVAEKVKEKADGK